MVYAARMRRLKLRVAVWGVWTILITTLWVAHEWDVNGAFERFGHEGDADRRNHTLSAAIGVPTLIVGIMALGVYFVRPTADRGLRMQQLKFHASRMFGMVANAACADRWQDNGFERWSNNSLARRLVDVDRWRVGLAVVGWFGCWRVCERPTDALT